MYKNKELCICAYMCVHSTWLIYADNSCVAGTQLTSMQAATKRYSEVPARKCAPQSIFCLLLVPCSRSAVRMKDLRFQTLTRSKTRSPLANCKTLVES